MNIMQDNLELNVFRRIPSELHSGSSIRLDALLIFSECSRLFMYSD